MMHAPIRLFCFCLVAVLLVIQHQLSCSKLRAHRSQRREQTEILPLKDASPFPVGAVWSSGHSTWGAEKGTDLGGPSDIFEPGTFYSGGFDFSTIVQKEINEDQEHEVLRTQFNSLSSEAALKPHNIAISPTEIDFREADAMVAFAEENGMRVHGHVLLFQMSIPVWALEYEANNTWDAKQWEEWLENYIRTVVGRYKGRIASWDVLNEINGMFGGGLKTDEMFWYRVFGDNSYIEKSFRWAHEADPEAKLFINESLMELPLGKLRGVLDLANDLRALGVQVDGIGFQGLLLDSFLQSRI